jgi:hypothetical protein
VQRVAIVGSTTVVFCSFGGLGLFLSAGEESDYDEMVCGETLRVLCELIVAQCDKDVSENEFLAQYDRISLLVDHVIRHGVLEQTNPQILSAIVNLNLGSVSKKALDEPQLQRVSVPNYSVPALQKKGKSAPNKAKLHSELSARPRVESQIVVNMKRK